MDGVCERAVAAESVPHRPALGCLCSSCSDEISYISKGARWKSTELVHAYNGAWAGAGIPSALGSTFKYAHLGVPRTA